MKAEILRKKVQKKINTKVSDHSRHFSSEIMDRQIESLIEVIAPFLDIPSQSKLNLKGDSLTISFFY
jgi:transcriptional antiterminator